ncbi:MAG TPA: CCA tRNA nucleotidyltransferase [Spirochaetota bacterium]|jgi:poly(A) polymerase/tRNA nucleotidyltransferase (CCA-adding enzyme)|nr:MAG: CCA-adding enzyme [Spirochaetes bacterium ADurb.Bin133]HNZ26457.1 CCA tRNA nucleotidyltransferase [Spirochaetota bacterium]HPY86972.1 CCA tRNA nucleotidyltransferase [Spirochaetota bacterium]HQB60785.1 CCA tRNA nucleotidyltransferase [Spirochaetota bacterium]
MKIPSVVKRFAKIFHKNGYELYLVGGAVRDYLLGNKNSDYDFASSATPSEIMKIFSTVIPVGIQHGTVIVIYEESQFEVTTFRLDGKYSDNRRPDGVEFIRSIEEDLKRRDFTINSLAFDLNRRKIIDKFQGQKDLKRKIIKAIGNPDDRFTEDALRMLRACRFASKLNFSIEEETFESIKRNAELINNISVERIRDEFIKILQTDKPSIGLEYLRETGLMRHILPEFLEGYGVVQNKFHKYDVYYHNLYSCDAAPKDNYLVRIAALFHDIAKPKTKREKSEEIENENSFYNHEIIGERITNQILKRLKFPREDIKKIRNLIRNHMFYYTDEWTDGAVRRFIKKVGLENLPELFQLRESDRIGNGSKTGVPKAFLDFQERIKDILEIDGALKVTDLDISGNDLIRELNLKPSPMIGEILNYLLEIVLDDPELNTNPTLIDKAKEYYNKKKEFALENYKDSPENLGKF